MCEQAPTNINLGSTFQQAERGEGVSASIEEKLRNYIETPGPLSTKCWIWQGAFFDDGYGVCHWHDGDRLHQRAHRISWMFHNGEIPDDLLVLHHCDTPACVNPGHLYLGTPQDNMDDKMERGRHVAVEGEDHGCAKLSEMDVAHIRYFLEQGYGVNIPAERYGVTHAQIQHIRDRSAWKHVEAFRPSTGQPLPRLFGPALVRPQSSNTISTNLSTRSTTLTNERRTHA
jgi:hypothetical protein